MLNSLGEQDIFVASYDLDGNLIWAKSIGSSGVEAGQSAVGDIEGNIFITGVFEATLDFDAGINTTELTSDGGYDSFISKYAADGSYEWAVNIGGAADDYPYRIDVASTGDVYNAGWVSGNLDFNFGTDVSVYNVQGGRGIYLLKLTQPICTPVYFEQSLILCKGQQIEVGSSTYNDAGIYTDVLIAINGCDSIVTTTIEDGADIITDTDIGGTTIIALQDNAHYQWLDCEDDYTPMLNAINQAFNPTQTGYYAVEITIGSCSDTSTCVYVIIDNISQLMDFENILIYPNPSSGILNFELRTEAELELMNAIGEVVFSKKMNSGVKQLDFAYLASGLYYVNLHSQTQRKSFNWLKE